MNNKKEIDPATLPLGRLPLILRQSLDQHLCTCNEVKKVVVINAIANGAITLEAVRKQTFASDGNGCCTRQVERLIECLTGKCDDSVDAEDGPPSTQPT